MEKISTGRVIDEVVELTHFPPAQVKQTIDALIHVIGEQVAQGNRVQIQGLGTFDMRERSERAGVHPGTQERITIPASTTVGFRPATALKDRLGANPLTQAVGSDQEPVKPLTSG